MGKRKVLYCSRSKLEQIRRRRILRSSAAPEDFANSNRGTGRPESPPASSNQARRLDDTNWSFTSSSTVVLAHQPVVQSSVINSHPITTISLYDAVRSPRYVDPKKMFVFRSVVEPFVQCPICRDILTNTVISKECMHRFCYECITSALRKGNKECPQCRAKLLSKRDLRPDLLFDSLIDTIFRRESHRFSVDLSWMSNNSMNDYGKRGSCSTGSDLVTSYVLNRAEKQQDLSNFLVFRPYPEMLVHFELPRQALKERYISVYNGNATVEHLARLLMKRIHCNLLAIPDANIGTDMTTFLLDKIAHCELFIFNRRQYISLDPHRSMLVERINAIFGLRSNPLVVYFCLHNPQFYNNECISRYKLPLIRPTVYNDSQKMMLGDR